MTDAPISFTLDAALKTQATAHGPTLDTWMKALVVENAAPESEQEEDAKLGWLRAATKEGFDAIEKDDYAALVSDEDVTMFMRQIHDEVKAELAAERRIG